MKRKIHEFEICSWDEEAEDRECEGPQLRERIAELERELVEAHELLVAEAKHGRKMVAEEREWLAQDLDGAAIQHAAFGNDVAAIALRRKAREFRALGDE